ncbi:MAG: threonine synthase [Steroidobacteraceae bacterium]
MQFVSTRSAGETASFATALTRGLASDGGLYVPSQWPSFAPAQFADDNTLAQLAARVIEPFAAGDVLAPQLGAIVAEAFNFPAPLEMVDVGKNLRVLELFHGPTAAFKDFGARFLAAALAQLRAGHRKTLRILVATSGDTGGAVAAAFHRRPGIEVVVLFPKGLVSPTQERQLTCWGDNVHSFAVRGSFDDCQRMVKEAFRDPWFTADADLSSANSINVGRLLPQAVYYVAASLAIQRATGQSASFIVPSGNLGNSVACAWARRMGLPIDQIYLAHDLNRMVPDYLATGRLEPRPGVTTLASAMNVGDPSNLERMRALYPDLKQIRGAVCATSITDGQIAARIRADFERYGRVWCPHTAVAAQAFVDMPDALRNDAGGRPRNWVMVSTAHPAKFREIVTPLIGREPEVPENLARLFERPSQFDEIEAALPSLRTALSPKR